MKNFSWKLVLVFVVLVTAIIYILPSLKPALWPHKQINLGLDLQGGMHLVLEVDTEKALESTVERVSQEIREQLKKERIRNVAIERVEGINISIQIKKEESIDKFKALLDSDFRDLRELSNRMVNGVQTILMDIPDSDREQIEKLAVDQALETIRNRIDQFGVSEPDIRRQGANRILIQLPGIKDTERAKDLIGKTALLEFKLVDDTQSIDSALKGNLPPGREVLYRIDEDPETQRTAKTPFLLKKRTLLTGAYLTDARVQIDSQFNEPYVSINFDKKGARIFERITEDNVQKRLAIVLDNSVYSAPVIQEKIAGGQARICLLYTSPSPRD